MAKKGKRERRRGKEGRQAPYPIRKNADWERARRDGGMVFFREDGPLDEAEATARFREHLDQIEERRVEFSRGKAELIDLLAPHDGFDLLAALQISSLRIWGKGERPLGSGMEVLRELMALLLVERRTLAPTGGEGGEETFVAALQRHEAFARAVTALWPELLVPLPFFLDKSPDAELDRIRNRVAAGSLLWPFSENDDQAERTAAELFEDPTVRDHLVKTLGTDATDALSLIEAAGEITGRSLRSLLREAEGPIGWSDHGSALSFSVQELARAAGVDDGQAERFVARFSLPLDGRSFELGDLTTAARQRPLLRDGERVIPVSIPTLRRTLRRSLTALLNPAIPTAGAGDKKAFSIFTAGRGSWLEEKTASLLEQFLRPDWIDTNVYFRLPTGRRGEIDVLVRVDDTLLVVQAKAGATRVDTELGDRERFRDTFTQLLGGEDLRQHRDGQAALTSGATLTHDAAGREALGRRVDGVSRLLPLHVTLEDLSVVGGQPWLLVDAGLASDTDLPWIVGVDQMELLLEYFELPALFLHFLTRRLKANGARLFLAQDEVDWALRYAEDELLWADLPPDLPHKKEQFAVLEEDHDFELWQLARQAGEKAKRPRPKLSGGTRKLLARLDRSRPPGWLGFSLALLDLPGTQRPKIVRAWERQLSSNRSKPGLPIDIGFGANGILETGFSILREERELHSEVDAVSVSSANSSCDITKRRGGGASSRPSSPAGPSDGVVGRRRDRQSTRGSSHAHCQLPSSAGSSARQDTSRAPARSRVRWSSRRMRSCIHWTLA